MITSLQVASMARHSCQPRCRRRGDPYHHVTICRLSDHHRVSPQSGVCSLAAREPTGPIGVALKVGPPVLGCHGATCCPVRGRSRCTSQQAARWHPISRPGPFLSSPTGEPTDSCGVRNDADTSRPVRGFAASRWFGRHPVGVPAQAAHAANGDRKSVV